MGKINGLIIPFVVIIVILVILGLSLDWSYKEYLGSIGALLAMSCFYYLLGSKRFEQPPKEESE